MDVRTGVSWMCSFIRSWADSTEERFSGRVLERSAIVCRWKSEWFVRFLSCVNSLLQVSGSVVLDSLD